MDITRRFSKFVPEPVKKPLRFVVDAGAWRPSGAATVLQDLWHRDWNESQAFTDEDHLLAAIDWLERAQDASDDGGFAGRYRLDDGWTSSYPETTGYIIPTLLRLSEGFGDRFIERASRAVDFLLSVQLESGAFPGMEIAENRTEPSVFNTAQIVTGLRAWHEMSGDALAMEAAARACDWMVRIQDSDGAWRRHTYGTPEYTYMAHAACWLAEMGSYGGNAKYLDAARRHLDWVLSHRDKGSGWFDKCGWGPQEHEQGIAVTHTIAYTVWGVLLLGTILQDEEGLTAARIAAQAIARRLELSKTLPAVLDSQWSARSDYVCLTGNAQMALIWFELHRLHADLPLVSAAFKAIDEVKRAQRMRGSSDGVKGGVPGSDPIWGGYIRLAMPNWAVKFFIDALLEKQALLASLRIPESAPPKLPEGIPTEVTPQSDPASVTDSRIVLTSTLHSRKIRQLLDAWEGRAVTPRAVLLLCRPEPSAVSRLKQAIRNGGAVAVLHAIGRRLRLHRDPQGASVAKVPTESLSDLCTERGIPIVEVDSFESASGLASMRALNPDLVVFAGGGILRDAMIRIPRIGILNAHMGILPPFRGMNVTEWARLLGEPVGCTVHFIDHGIDTGDIVCARAVPIDGMRNVRELREAVDDVQMKLLAHVAEAIARLGARPLTLSQTPEGGRQYFRMHEDLVSCLDSALERDAMESHENSL